MRVTNALPAALALTLFGAACTVGESANGAAEAPPVNATAPNCEPVEQGPPEAPDQEPAFEGQTRACAVDSNVAFEVDVIARGLEHPWAVEPLPNGDLLVTERPGRLRIITASGAIGSPIEGLPEVDARNQGGLLDVELSPDFATDRTIYWSYAEPRDGGNGTSVARGVLSEDGSSVSNVEVIFRGMPTYDGTLHFGSRLAFAPDGMLYITTGERSDLPMRMHSQTPDNHLGKTIRIRPDGSVPPDNPFVDHEDAAPEVWSIGHRNIQSAVVSPTGEFWTVEHGPRGGDELNLIRPGENYGWPIQTYGIEYRGAEVQSAETQRPGIVQPVYYWDPVIAPSGMEWYTGDAFPEWQNSVFVGGMVTRSLVRLEIEGERVTGEEHLLTERDRRIRDVRQGPDGALYIVTDHEDGELLRIRPAN